MTLHRLATIAIPVAAALVFSGCEASKSANPTSPSVAGPIAGVNITTPEPVAPKGTAIPAKDQPVTLVVQNASTNGQRAVTYRFEVAADADFSNKVAGREGVEPGADGKTAYRLPDALPRQRPPVSAGAGGSRVSEALWVCGEAVAPPSIHWALVSGEAAAGAVIAELGGLAQVG